MLQLSTEHDEPADGSITIVASMVFNKMHEARKHLDALRVAIGGTPSPAGLKPSASLERS